MEKEIIECPLQVYMTTLCGEMNPKYNYDECNECIKETINDLLSFLQKLKNKEEKNERK